MIFFLTQKLMMKYSITINSHKWINFNRCLKFPFQDFPFLDAKTYVEILYYRDILTLYIKIQGKIFFLWNKAALRWWIAICRHLMWENRESNLHIWGHNEDERHNEQIMEMKSDKRVWLRFSNFWWFSKKWGQRLNLWKKLNACFLRVSEANEVYISSHTWVASTTFKQL